MQVAADILEILNSAIINGDAVTLPGQLDRKLYTKVDKVIGMAGGKWDRRRGAHIFAGDAACALEPILLTGTITNQRDEFGLFETPPAVVAAVLERARIGINDCILEPSAGRGALAIPAAARGFVVDAHEIQQANCDALKAVGVANIEVHCEDFLQVAPLPEYEVVVMNPPFSRQQDARHILHAAKFLAPGGRLIAVASAAVRFRDTALYRELRDIAATIEDLPEGSFRTSGTNVNTVLITIET